MTSGACRPLALFHTTLPPAQLSLPPLRSVTCPHPDPTPTTVSRPGSGAEDGPPGERRSASPANVPPAVPLPGDPPGQRWRGTGGGDVLVVPPWWVGAVIDTGPPGRGSHGDCRPQ